MSYVRNNYPSVLGTFSDISGQQLLLLTNEKRQENGQPPLTISNELSQAAANKASDMFSKDYWAHIAPDGTTPWVFIKSSGYNYVYAGENLARGYYSASDVISAWMASTEHKENMLSGHYQNVGFSATTGKLNGEDTVLVVEMLGSTNLAVAPASQEQPKPVQVAVAVTSPTIAPTAPPPTLTPTVAPIAEGTLGEQKINPSDMSKIVSQTPVSKVKPLVNSATLSSNSSRAIVSLFIFILILDMVIIERKKIVRFVGHNLDHVFFFSLVLLIIILAKGAII